MISIKCEDCAHKEHCSYLALARRYPSWGGAYDKEGTEFDKIFFPDKTDEYRSLRQNVESLVVGAIARVCAKFKESDESKEREYLKIAKDAMKKESEEKLN